MRTLRLAGWNPVSQPHGVHPEQGTSTLSRECPAGDAQEGPGSAFLAECPGALAMPRAALASRPLSSLLQCSASDSPFSTQSGQSSARPCWTSSLSCAAHHPVPESRVPWVSGFTVKKLVLGLLLYAASLLYTLQSSSIHRGPEDPPPPALEQSAPFPSPWSPVRGRHRMARPERQPLT